MMAPQVHRSSPAAPAMPALPWEWFDFTAPLRPAAEIPQGTTENCGGGPAGGMPGWSVEVAGRLVPFKWLRGAARGAGERKPLLIMLPGMGLTIASFRGVARRLLESHDIALLDYAALSTHACTATDGWPRGGVPIQDLAPAIWAVADAVGAQRFSLAGNSLGGSLCLVAALEKPERIDRIVLANPACYPQTLPRMYRLARIRLLGPLFMTCAGPERFVTGVEHIGYADQSRFDPELRDRCRRCMAVRRNRLRLMEMIRRLPAGPSDTSMARHISRLREIARPVMVTWGLQDPLLAPGSGERLANDLPNCAYRPHADLSHMPHEEDPQRIAAEWAEFLKVE